MPKLSAKQTAERRKRFLDAARNCFARDGFHKTTMADICAEAGLSVGAIYLYFSSKEDLILAVVDDRMEELQDTAATGAIDDLKGIFSVLLAPEADLNDIRLELGALYESFSNPDLHSRIHRNSALIESAILKLLDNLRHQGKARLRFDPKTTARLTQIFLAGLFFKQAVDKDDLDKTNLDDLKVAFAALLEEPKR